MQTKAMVKAHSGRIHLQKKKQKKKRESRRRRQCVKVFRGESGSQSRAFWDMQSQDYQVETSYPGTQTHSWIHCNAVRPQIKNKI